MHVKGLHKEQDEVMGLVAKHLLGPVRYRKALGIQGRVVARPKEEDKPKKPVRKGKCEQGETAAKTGCTPASGSGGKTSEGPETVIAEKQPSAKAVKAKAAHVMVNKEIQRYAEEYNEPRFARVVNGKSLPNGEPADVITENGDGVELKTMVKNGNDKITMDTYSQVRKTIWQQEQGKDFHTVVSDDRQVFNAAGHGEHDDSKRVYYYRRGVAGSARVQGMYRCQSEDELKRLMSLPEKELPKEAQRTDAKLRVGKWVPFTNSKGRGFKNKKTGQVVRAKK